MIRMTKAQVMRIHSKLTAVTGGADGVREIGLLESALEAPFQTFGGYELYPTLVEKGARLGASLVGNHPFVDGNKRIGVHAMLVFLALNGIEPKYTQVELADLGIALADGSMKYEELLEWLRAHIG